MNRNDQVSFIAAEVIRLLERTVPEVASTVKASREMADPIFRLSQKFDEDTVARVQDILRLTNTRLVVDERKDRSAVGPLQARWLRSVVGDELAEPVLDRAELDEDHRPGGAAYFSKVKAAENPAQKYVDQVRRKHAPKREDETKSTSNPAAAFVAELQRQGAVHGN